MHFDLSFVESISECTIRGHRTFLDKTGHMHSHLQGNIQMKLKAKVIKKTIDFKFKTYNI